MKKALMLVDERNLPSTLSYYGIIHELMRRYYEANKDSLQYELVISTPEDVADRLGEINVVIDRTLVYSPRVIDFHKRAGELQIPYLNSPKVMKMFASKFELYSTLKGTNIQQPDTAQLKEVGQIAEFLDKYRRVVVKPEWGGMGDWVYFISYLEQNLIRVTSRVKENGENIDWEFKGTLAEFWENTLPIELR